MSSKYQDEEKKTQQLGPSYIDDEAKEEEQVPAVQKNSIDLGLARGTVGRGNENPNPKKGKVKQASHANEKKGKVKQASHAQQPGAVDGQHQRPDHDDPLGAADTPGAVRMGDSSSKGFSDDGAQYDSGLSQTRSNVLSSDDKDVTTLLEAVLVVEVEEGMATEEDRQRLKQEIRDEFLQSAVTGEVAKVQDNDAPINGNRRKMFLVIGVIILIGVIVGIVLGTSKEATVVVDNAQSSATVSPQSSTSQPTSTPQPSPMPSTMPTSTPQPSPVPSTMPSVEPSAAPSVPIANLDNRNIEEAHPLGLRDAPLEASLSNAAIQEFKVDCGGASFVSTTGLWYAYFAKSSGPVNVIACGATNVDVYKNDFACVLTEYTNGDIGNCGGSSISWEAEMGERYYVLVSPAPDSEGGSSTREDFTIQIVDNDKCEHAFGPVTPTSFGAIVSYTTTNAEVDSHVVSTCGGASASTTPGVWYEVEGDGRPLTASTCSDETTFDTQISVFRGSSCGNLTCVNGNNDFCELKSTVRWPSQVGEIYHVLVHGSNGSTGQFKLEISTNAVPKINDFCETAEVVVAGDQVTFAFSGSTADPDLPLCDNGPGGLGDDGTADFPYGIWYSVMGTGIPISATVDLSSISPITMNVYSGSCNTGLSCVEIQASIGCQGSGVFSSCRETFCFASNKGEVYYVFVSTVSVEGIDFAHTLKIGSCVVPKINDFCETAEVVVAGDPVIFFAFSGSTADPDLPLCVNGPGGLGDDGTAEFPYGIWYSVMGTGIPISATVDLSSISPITMNVYSGICNTGLSCVEIQPSIDCQVVGGGSSSCQETSCFASNEGEVYYVFVSTVSLESIDAAHTLKIGSCVLSI